LDPEEDPLDLLDSEDEGEEEEYDEAPEEEDPLDPEEEDPLDPDWLYLMQLRHQQFQLQQQGQQSQSQQLTLYMLPSFSLGSLLPISLSSTTILICATRRPRPSVYICKGLIPNRMLNSRNL